MLAWIRRCSYLLALIGLALILDSLDQHFIKQSIRRIGPAVMGGSSNFTLFLKMPLKAFGWKSPLEYIAEGKAGFVLDYLRLTR